MERTTNAVRQDKYRTCSEPNETSNNPNILKVVAAIGKDRLSARSLQERLQLKGRDNFLNLYLKPAIREGLITPLYPDSPRHPRQKYLLTQKGLALYSSQTGNAEKIDRNP